jgi:hypothetical protein
MKLNDSAETGLIVAGLAVAAYILYKSGGFGLLKKTTEAAGTVIDDTLDLPQNVITLAGLVPQIPLAIVQNTAAPVTQQSIFDNAIQGKVQTFPGVASITQRTANMIQSVYSRYTGVTASNWNQVAVSHHAKFDSNGYIISDDLSSTQGTNADMSYIAAHGGTI